MIGRPAIVERVAEWHLREDVIEKDYVLGWLLWGIGSDPILANGWVFKGGTCLKKCYVETYRFSEDLDFTVIPGGPTDEASAKEALQRVVARVQEESGLDFAARAIVMRARPGGSSLEGRVYYRGPRGAQEPASIKVDLSIAETVVRPPVLRAISHPYPDALPGPATVRCYSYEEVFAEKLRAMAERGRPRDLYDIVNLYWRPDFRDHADLVRSTLEEKCLAKGIPMPTADSIAAASTRVELESEWEHMLGHQLPTLPPFLHFWSELPGLFDWLDGRARAPMLPHIPLGADDDPTWSPPPTVATWKSGIPLESVRFAAANRLCVELGYRGSTRVIEPYSLRRGRDGQLLLYAIKAETRQVRSYRVSRIQTVNVTTRPFRPVRPIELPSRGLLPAPATSRRASRGRLTGNVYILECASCGRHFRRTRRTTTLTAHKDAYGERCYGRYGSIVNDW
jgi:predicted nucleotidyltransferase component of viral defense system